MLEILLNGVGSGQGFLIAPWANRVFPGTVQLRVVNGPGLDVNFRTANASAATVYFDVPSIHVGVAPITVKIHAAAGSAAVNDVAFEVVSGGNLAATFTLSVVQKPVLRYAGRFQCRLATDPDPYNSPWGANSSFGMYSVEGPDPNHTDEPPLDRIIRLQNPVALRPFCEPVGTRVSSIEGQIGPTTVAFQRGDPVLGLPVKLGPNSVFESQDGAFAQPGFEPISGFEFFIGTVFYGESAAAVPRNNSDLPGSTAPYADGLFKLDEIGPWKPADFGYPELTWAQHAVAVTTAKVAALKVQVNGSPYELRIRDRRLQEHANNLSGIQFAMRLIERYSGLIDQKLAINPGDSAVLSYLASSPKLAYYGEFFDFDTDAQCGTATGTIAIT